MLKLVSIIIIYHCCFFENDHVEEKSPHLSVCILSTSSEYQLVTEIDIIEVTQF